MPDAIVSQMVGLASHPPSLHRAQERQSCLTDSKALLGIPYEVVAALLWQQSPS